MQKLVANESVQLGAFPRPGGQQRVHMRERLDAARDRRRNQPDRRPGPEQDADQLRSDSAFLDEGRQEG
jgi:hypothetical protein